MFDSNEQVITKVLNPLKVTKSSIIEFSIGELKNTGLYRFMKIIEMDVGGRSYTRYLIYSKLENTEYVLEIFQGNNQESETYLYHLSDVVPFSEEFLEVSGRKYLTTPQGDEYERCVMPENDDRIDGIAGRVKIFNIETNAIEREFDIKIWDYQRDFNENTEFLNIEMSEETGEFKIFVGEIIEDIFYKFYQTSK